MEEEEKQLRTRRMLEDGERRKKTKGEDERTELKINTIGWLGVCSPLAHSLTPSPSLPPSLPFFLQPPTNRPSNAAIITERVSLVVNEEPNSPLPLPPSPPHPCPITAVFSVKFALPPKVFVRERAPLRGREPARAKLSLLGTLEEQSWNGRSNSTTTITPGRVTDLGVSSLLLLPPGEVGMY